MRTRTGVSAATPLLERISPHLADAGYTITSPHNPDYNCIAWAAGNDQNWWWPELDDDRYWPADVPCEWTIDAFIQAFGTLGYVPCDNGELEPDTEKVVIYVNADALSTHAARQLPSSLWTSKLGQLEDISHHSLDGISGSLYGTPRQFLERRRV